MVAYVINDMEITDPAAFKGYKKMSPPTVAKYGGRFLSRGGASEKLEGSDRYPRVSQHGAGQGMGGFARIRTGQTGSVRQRHDSGNLARLADGSARRSLT